MKRMLVCLDGSPRERGVLDAAMALGKKSGAKLVLFRSVGIPADLPPEAYAISPTEVPGLLEGRARRDLEKLVEALPAELRGGVHTTVGSPWRSIEAVATEEDVDLIVIGSHGYEAADRLLGTTAAKVVNHSDRSVLVVRSPERLAR